MGPARASPARTYYHMTPNYNNTDSPMSPAFPAKDVQHRRRPLSLTQRSLNDSTTASSTSHLDLPAAARATFHDSEANPTQRQLTSSGLLQFPSFYIRAQQMKTTSKSHLMTKRQRPPKAVNNRRLNADAMLSHRDYAADQAGVCQAELNERCCWIEAWGTTRPTAQLRRSIQAIADTGQLADKISEGIDVIPDIIQSSTYRDQIPKSTRMSSYRLLTPTMDVSFEAHFNYYSSHAIGGHWRNVYCFATPAVTSGLAWDFLLCDSHNDNHSGALSLWSDPTGEPTPTLQSSHGSSTLDQTKPTSHSSKNIPLSDTLLILCAQQISTTQLIRLPCEKTSILEDDQQPSVRGNEVIELHHCRSLHSRTPHGIDTTLGIRRDVDPQGVRGPCPSLPFFTISQTILTWLTRRDTAPTPMRNYTAEPINYGFSGYRLHGFNGASCVITEKSNRCEANVFVNDPVGIGIGRLLYTRLAFASTWTSAILALPTTSTSCKLSSASASGSPSPYQPRCHTQTLAGMVAEITVTNFHSASFLVSSIMQGWGSHVCALHPASHFSMRRVPPMAFTMFIEDVITKANWDASRHCSGDIFIIYTFEPEILGYPGLHKWCGLLLLREQFSKGVAQKGHERRHVLRVSFLPLGSALAHVVRPLSSGELLSLIHCKTMDATVPQQDEEQSNLPPSKRRHGQNYVVTTSPFSYEQEGELLELKNWQKTLKQQYRTRNSTSPLSVTGNPRWIHHLQQKVSDIRHINGTGFEYHLTPRETILANGRSMAVLLHNKVIAPLEDWLRLKIKIVSPDIIKYIMSYITIEVARHQNIIMKPIYDARGSFKGVPYKAVTRLRQKLVHKRRESNYRVHALRYLNDMMRLLLSIAAARKHMVRVLEVIGTGHFARGWNQIIKVDGAGFQDDLYSINDKHLGGYYLMTRRPPMELDCNLNSRIARSLIECGLRQSPDCEHLFVCKGMLSVLVFKESLIVVAADQAALDHLQGSFRYPTEYTTSVGQNLRIDIDVIRNGYQYHLPARVSQQEITITQHKIVADLRREHSFTKLDVWIEGINGTLRRLLDRLVDICLISRFDLFPVAWHMLIDEMVTRRRLEKIHGIHDTPATSASPSLTSEYLPIKIRAMQLLAALANSPSFDPGYRLCGRNPNEEIQDGFMVRSSMTHYDCPNLQHPVPKGVGLITLNNDIIAMRISDNIFEDGYSLSQIMAIEEYNLITERVRYMRKMKRLYMGGLASIPDEAAHPSYDFRTPEDRDREYTDLFGTQFIVPSQEMYDMTPAERQGGIENPRIRNGWSWIDPGGANQAYSMQCFTEEWFRIFFGGMQE